MPGKKKAAAASKPRKPNQRDAVKKLGKKADMWEFRAQVDSVGIKIVEVTMDGNRFFRAMGDQLEGDEEQHMKYREMVVQYILEHREKYEPFIEDEVPFDEYCGSMMKDGTWAGNMELWLPLSRAETYAFTCLTHHDGTSTTFLVVQLAIWFIYRIITVSTTITEDPCQGPAMPVVIKTYANVASTSNNGQTKAKDLKKSSNRSTYDDKLLNQVYYSENIINMHMEEKCEFKNKMDLSDSDLQVKVQQIFFCGRFCNPTTRALKQKICLQI